MSDPHAEHVVDQLLVMGAQDGRAGNFDRLVHRWAPRLLAHARALLGPGDDARDAAQDAWLAIARSIRRLDDPAAFPAWAMRIVTNKAADRIRRAARRRTADLAARPAAVAAPRRDPLDDDAIDRLRRAVRRLPLEQQSLLSMMYAGGLSIAQISSAMAIPPGTVKSRLHHIRRALRTELADEPAADHRPPVHARSPA